MVTVSAQKNTLTQHDTKWVSPSPMWETFSDTSTRQARKEFHRPTLLRFNNDNFMDELLSVMSYYPEALSEWKAQPETWREPMATPATAEKLELAQPISQFTKSQTQHLKSSVVENSSVKSTVVANDSAIDKTQKPLKLYQAAHLRFYLVTASFVCRQVGLPDRKIDLAKQQKAHFVLRRLLPKDLTQAIDPERCDIEQCNEYAYLLNDDGPQWQKVDEGASANNETILNGEERLPMFNVGYEESIDKKRRMLAGYIPVGKRETYLNAEITENNYVADNNAVNIMRKQHAAITHLFQIQVASPWKRLISQALNEANKVNDWNDNPPPIVVDLGASPTTDSSEKNTIKISREKIQTTSWYILVDMLQFFKDYIPNIYSYIDISIAPEGITEQENELYEALAGIVLNRLDYSDDFILESYHNYSDLYGSLLSALKHLIDNPEIEADLERVDYHYDRESVDENAQYSWPSFLFPLADPDRLKSMPLPDLEIAEPSDAEPDTLHDQIDALTALISNAIPSVLEKRAPDVDAIIPPKQSNATGWFIIRCVFESPNCGPFHPPIVSESTEPFQMASFFDPDAPGRPIKIPMPLDISPAGLRKFNKNATFMISDMLCGKIRSVRKTTLGDLVLSVLPWPFHKDLPDPGEAGPCQKNGSSFGMFCSLSIPIVTLCAMILLIIMVTLFDIFFRWLPLLFVCFPIPGLKGKQ